MASRKSIYLDFPPSQLNCSLPNLFSSSLGEFCRLSSVFRTLNRCRQGSWSEGGCRWRGGSRGWRLDLFAQYCGPGVCFVPMILLIGPSEFEHDSPSSTIFLSFLNYFFAYKKSKVYYLIPRKYSTFWRSILMWLYFPVDLTGNVNMIEKLVLGGTRTGDLPISRSSVQRANLCAIPSRYKRLTYFMCSSAIFFE